MCEGDDVMLDAEPLVLYGAVDDGDDVEVFVDVDSGTNVISNNARQDRIG